MKLSPEDYVWKHSALARERVLSRLTHLAQTPECYQWEGQTRKHKSGDMANLDTWLSRLEMSLEREAHLPPILIGLLQVAAYRIHGHEASGTIIMILSQMRVDFPLAVLNAVIESIAVSVTLGTDDARPGRRRWFAEFVLLHPRSTELCEAIMTMLSQQLATVIHLYGIAPAFPESKELQTA